MPIVELERDAPAAHDAIQRGRWDDADVLIREVGRQTDPAAIAWSAAFTAAQALVRGQVDLPAREPLAALPVDEDSVRIPTRSVADHGVVAALARFDLDELAPWAELASRCDPGDRLRASITEARLSFARGELDTTLERCRSIPIDAATPLAIEAACLRSLSALTLGHADEARSAARKACRASRQSELRAYRFLSGLVLARVRRALGRGHLAGRILCAMRPILPVTYRGWLRWELLLAGQETLATEGCGRSHDAAESLRAAFDAASAGDRDRLDHAMQAVAEHAAKVAFLAPEIETLRALLDPAFRVEDATEELRPFLSGEVARVPWGLDTISSAMESEGRPVAVVLRRVDQTPRRLLTIATPLVADATVLPLTRLRKGRVDLACAVLALSSDGLADEELFRACYGFTYARHLHESVLSMLVSRVRDRLQGHYEVVRSGGTVRLEGSATILAPDPRCVADVEQKLLKLVARMGSVSTRVAARELGVSLRTVQDTVSRLVDDDELTMDRSGRSVGYRLEDTSFSDLTPT